MIQNAINSPEFQTPESFATVSPMCQLRNVNPSTSQMIHSAGLFFTHLLESRNNYVNHNLPVTSMMSCAMTLLADKMFELNWTSLFGAHYNWTFNQLKFSLVKLSVSWTFSHLTATVECIETQSQSFNSTRKAKWHSHEKLNSATIMHTAPSGWLAPSKQLLSWATISAKTLRQLDLHILVLRTAQMSHASLKASALPKIKQVIGPPTSTFITNPHDIWQLTHGNKTLLSPSQSHQVQPKQS